MKRTILVPITGNIRAEPLLDAALSAARVIDADLRMLFIQPDPATAAGYMAEMPLAGFSTEAILAGMGEIAATERYAFRAWRMDHGIADPSDEGRAGIAASWTDQTGAIDATVSRFGRLVDMIVAYRPQDKSVVARHLLEAAVFGAGRPTLVIGGPLPAGFADHILIAWNGSLEASRALAGAMPFLERARRVSIFSAHEYDRDAVDLSDLASALSARGIATPEVVFCPRRGPAGPKLVAAADAQGATMIVMGAYTHSRLRESVLGGVTRHMLTQAPVPLLMCH